MLIFITGAFPIFLKDDVYVWKFCINVTSKKHVNWF